MILGKDDIKKFCIIKNDLNIGYDEYSYALRIGGEYINSNNRPIDVRNKNSKIIKIPKLEGIVVSTYEALRMPDDVYGRFDLKVKLAVNKGLFFQAGPQVKPGYKGILWGYLINLSDNEVELEAGEDEIFDIEFHKIEQHISKQKENNKLSQQKIYDSLQVVRKDGKISDIPKKSILAKAVRRSKSAITFTNLSVAIALLGIFLATIVALIVGSSYLIPSRVENVIADRTLNDKENDSRIEIGNNEYSQTNAKLIDIEGEMHVLYSENNKYYLIKIDDNNIPDYIKEETKVQSKETEKTGIINAY